MSLRIIAGRHRGRRLTAPPGRITRPTGARAREALFAILEHGDPPLRGSRCLDLFAGSGALALEAVSRGASEALCVERSRAAVAAIRANIARLGEGGRISVLEADASRLGPARNAYDLVLLDPPYGSGLAVPALLAALRQGWIAPGARLVVELAAAEALPLPELLSVEDQRRYGAARFVFLRGAGA